MLVIIQDCFISALNRQGTNSLSHSRSRLKLTKKRVFSPLKWTWVASTEINFRAGNESNEIALGNYCRVKAGEYEQINKSTKMRLLDRA
jgi:hypothetical protein